MPPAFFRGPIEGISPWLMPVAHGLEHAREELIEVAPSIPGGTLWRRPCGAASVGWHLLHIIGATDRLFTYAHGQPLDDRQRTWLDLERSGEAEFNADQLLEILGTTFDFSQSALRSVDEADLHQIRKVGGGQLPATMLGLLFHAAEHAQRHSGQIVTTVKVLAGQSQGS
ncbi:MAG: DinB family protein [Acidobacteriota bacterium]